LPVSLDRDRDSAGGGDNEACQEENSELKSDPPQAAGALSPTEEPLPAAKMTSEEMFRKQARFELINYFFSGSNQIN